jgi:hypothetical protein
MTASSKRPFWMHQVVEYILGGALVATGLQSPTPLVPTLLGGLVMLHAALTTGPLGAFRVIGRRLHRVIDVGIISIALLAVVQPWIEIDSGTRIVIAGIALVYLFVWWQTSFAQRIKSPSVSGEGGRSADVGRFAGRLVGNGVNAVRRPRGDGR